MKNPKDKKTSARAVKLAPREHWYAEYNNSPTARIPGFIIKEGAVGTPVALVSEPQGGRLHPQGFARAQANAYAIVAIPDAVTLLERGLDCGIFDGAPVYRRDIKRLLARLKGSAK